MDILKEALDIAELLADADIEWAFVGGVAVGIHGFIRATEDIDILINSNDLEKLDNLLKEHGFLINKEAIEFKDDLNFLEELKLRVEEYFTLDVMISPDDFSELLDNKLSGSISGNKVYVVSKKDLIKMKKGTGRWKDLVDAEELEKMGSEKEDG